MLYFDSLTDKTFIYTLWHVSFHVAPPEGLSQISIHFRSSWLDGIHCIVGFRHYPFFLTPSFEGCISDFRI